MTHGMPMTPPAALGAIWNGPRVECWTCGTVLEPTPLLAALAVEFWSIPLHPAFATTADRRVPACSGSGRLIGPVKS